MKRRCVVVHSVSYLLRSTSFPLSEGRYFIFEGRFFLWKGFDFPCRKGGEEFSIIIIAASSSEWTGYLLKFWSFLSSETGGAILFYFYGRKLQVSREFFLWSVLVVLLWSLVEDFILAGMKVLRRDIFFYGRKLQVSREFFLCSVLGCSPLVRGHILCHHHDSWSHPLAFLHFTFDCIHNNKREFLLLQRPPLVSF